MYSCSIRRFGRECSNYKVNCRVFVVNFGPLAGSQKHNYNESGTPDRPRPHFMCFMLVFVFISRQHYIFDMVVTQKDWPPKNHVKLEHASKCTILFFLPEIKTLESNNSPILRDSSVGTLGDQRFSDSNL